LPKFKPKTIAEKKMTVLWLRFLTEINATTEEAPAELLANPDTAKALSLLEKSAYTEGQLEAYDRFWDAVYRERVFYDDGFKKGQAEGLEVGRYDEKKDTARRMKVDGMTVELVAKYTGLTMEQINSL
jgi:predicted transposase/invertase (TIGR01784 family)